MKAVGQIIFASLDGQITGLNYIRPQMDEKTLPALVYSYSGTNPIRVKGSVVSREFAVELNVIGRTYKESVEIAEQVVDKMEAIAGTTVAGFVIRYCTTAFTGDDFDEDLGYTTTISLNITINE